MEIEYRNKDYKRKSIYQVGNVISRYGSPFLVVKTNGNYCFVDLSDGTTFTTQCSSLEKLAKYYGTIGDRLVKAKLILDYKLDGDAEDEDVK